MDMTSGEAKKAVTVEWVTAFGMAIVKVTRHIGKEEFGRIHERLQIEFAILGFVCQC